MDIIAVLTARIEEYRKDNKNPCKNYATQDSAEKATRKMAAAAGRHFHNGPYANAQPARYVVFFNEAWGRWVGAIDMTELLRRPNSTGGYLGFCTGFFTF